MTDPAGAPEHLENPEFTRPPVWSGLPVTCLECGQGGVPVATEDGWRLPLHPGTDASSSGGCPGSLAAVPT